MKDDHSAESNEKSIFRLFDFYFLSYDCLYLQFSVTNLDFQLCYRPKNIPSKVVKFTGQIAETNDKSIFRILRFIVFEIWLILYWNSEKKIMLGGLCPSKLPVFVWGFAPQATDAFGLGIEYHWLGFLDQVTGYKDLCPQLTVKYKTDHISKTTKNWRKKTEELKNPFQNIGHLLK